MKKLATVSLILLMSASVHAQWWGGKKVKGNGKMTTETRETADYEKVNVAGSFDVILVSGNEGSIKIEAEENLLEYIITETEGDALKIKVQNGYNLETSRNKNILITVPFSSLNEVSLAGSGDVKGLSPITADDFKFAVAGSGDMELEVRAKNLKGSVAGSGDLTLQGLSTNANLNVAGSGDIHAADLKTVNAEASVAGSGDIAVNCDGGFLKARISGSGDIQYSGNPAKEDFKVVGSGTVRK